MEKTPRYTQRERNMVLGYAAQYKDVIENKRTDAESNRKKDEVWLQIAKEFNARVYHQRSAKQLRQLYKNMKLLLKKDLCGEDKGNRSFMDLLNTLSQQESVAQYIAEQMSPGGMGSGSCNANGGGSNYAGLAGANGARQSHVNDDYDDLKLPLYDGMDTDVILIKSETISDNEQTENGMDCLDDDDDDDCISPKAPEVCLEEEDEVLYGADLRQLQQHTQNESGAGAASGGSGLLAQNGTSGGDAGMGPRATSSPVCSTKTSVSSTGSYLSTAPKPEITIQNMGNIRVGAFANINKTLLNGNTGSNSANSNNNNNNNNSSSTGGGGSNNNNNNNNNVSSTALGQTALSPGSNSKGGDGNYGLNGTRALQLTQEQVDQHVLFNGLGLSAVHPPGQSLQAAINAATSGATSARSATHTTHTLQLPRLQRGLTNAATSLPNGMQHQQQHQQQQQQLREREQRETGTQKPHSSSGNFYGLNAANLSGGSGISSGSSSNTRGQQNEYMMSLAIEERKRKIDLLDAQIEYWQTLTKKLVGQPGHFPTPSCACHFPCSSAGAGGMAAVAAAAASGLQTQASSS